MRWHRSAFQSPQLQMAGRQQAGRGNVRRQVGGGGYPLSLTGFFPPLGFGVQKREADTVSSSLSPDSSSCGGWNGTITSSTPTFGPCSYEMPLGSTPSFQRV